MSSDRRKFIQQLCLGTAGLSLSSFTSQQWITDVAAVKAFARSIPEMEGVSSENILSFINAVEKDRLGLHSLMVVRHGKVVAEGWWDPYKPDLKHMLFSLSKSFTSTAVGFAVSEGRLTVEDKVISFFPNMLPDELTANLAAMRVKDLLTMTSGNGKDTMTPMRLGKESWVKTFLSLPVDHQPGTFFLYNSGATYMLSAIVQTLTGKTLVEYLKPRFFDPLEVKGADWETSPQGINTGAYGLRVKTEDIAKLGQFYLQKGKWNGKQLLPVKWVEEATSFQVPNVSLTTRDERSDWQQGYGYQFWRCRHNLYRGDGAVGQFSIVMPEQDAVIAITSETSNMQAIMNAVWNHLLPGIKNDRLPANASLQKSLRYKLSSLTLLPAKTHINSAIGSGISGRKFTLQQNSIGAKEATFTFDKNNCNFKIEDANMEYGITCGIDRFEKTDTFMPGDSTNLVEGNNNATKAVKVAASGTWTDQNTFVMNWMFYETPHSDTITCSFNNNAVTITFKNSMVGKNASFKESRPVLHGMLAV